MPTIEPLSPAAPGVSRLPLITPTLPPAEHTNAYLVGESDFIVVDPATYDERERARLFEAVEARRAIGHDLVAVVLTHHHFDHVGAASVLAERFDRPIWAHVETARRFAGEVARELSEGDRIAIGDRSLDVLFTPGHAPGHLTFVDRRPDGVVLLVGDMVASIGSIVIDPEDGDMARYIAELDRLARLEPRVLLPAHGAPVENGKDKLLAYVAHRLDRERRVFEALAERGSALPRELLPSAYSETPESIWWLAERACLAHLLKLEGEGRAEREGDRFRAR